MMRALRRNLGWKLLSFSVATGLWLSLSASRESTMAVPAPIQYRNTPKTLEISSEMVEMAHVVLRGPSSRLSRLAGTNTPVVIDLTEVRGPGERTFTLGRQNISLPAGITVERVIPAQIRLRLETRIARNVPVRIQTVNVPEGMVVESAVATPPNLTVVGPRSRVEMIAAVDADPVDVRSLNAMGEAEVHAYSGDPQVQFVKEPRVRVRVTIEPASAAK